MDKEDDFIKVTVNMSKAHHRKLKAIAAIKGIGLSTYIMECIEKITLRKREREVADDASHLEDESIRLLA